MNTTDPFAQIDACEELMRDAQAEFGKWGSAESLYVLNYTVERWREEVEACMRDLPFLTAMTTVRDAERMLRITYRSCVHVFETVAHGVRVPAGWRAIPNGEIDGKKIVTFVNDARAASVARFLDSRRIGHQASELY